MRKKIGNSLIKHEGRFFIMSLNRELFEVNEVGARIFDLCNGINTKDQIIDKLLTVFDMSKDVLSKDVDTYINQLIGLNLIESDE